MKKTKKPEPSGRRCLPPERKSVTKTIRVVGEDGEKISIHATVGLYEDGTPGEIFLVTSTKQGSVLSGLLDAWATALSFALQYGTPLEVMVHKFANARYGPSSPPGPDAASSVTDAVARWLRVKFLATPVE